MTESITADHVLDVKGLKCPMPVLKTKVRFKTMQPGEILEVITTDPGSRKDLPAWAAKTGNHVVGSREEGADIYHFFLQRPADEPVERPATAPLLVTIHASRASFSPAGPIQALSELSPSSALSASSVSKQSFPHRSPASLSSAWPLSRPGRPVSLISR